MIKILKHDRSSNIFILDGWDRRFKRFEAAFGWMPPAPDTPRKTKHALVLGGVQEDGRWNLFEEHLGTLHEVLEAAISVKDRYWLRRIFCDPTIGHVVAAMEIDGLTKYDFSGYDIHGRKIYDEKYPENRWPYFRGHEGTIVALVGVPAFVHTQPQHAFDKYDKLAAQKKLLRHSKCKEIGWCFEQQSSPKDIADHPVVSAVGNVLWALEKYEEKPAITGSKTYEPPYKDLR